VEFPIRITFVTSQDYQTRQLNTEEGNLTRPIRTRHNTHTHTGNTRQPKPQLKSSSCSSAIPSHNSRDVIPSHNSRNATCLTPIPSHNSRNTSKPTFKISPKPCRPRTSKSSKTNFATATWLDAAMESPGVTRFQTAWQGTRTARRQAPQMPLSASVAWQDDPHRQVPHILVALVCSYRLAVKTIPLGATPI